MDAPNLQHVIETFVRIGIPAEPPALQLWLRYVELLRSRILPLVKERMEADVINWYSFLVHNRDSGVPTSDDDLYVHLRMCLIKPLNETQFVEQLPEFCLFTRKMFPPNPPSLDTVDIQSLRNGQVELGWKLLGESSEWVLSMLEAHDPARPIPLQNVGELLHYLGNQLLVKAVQIPMP